MKRVHGEHAARDKGESAEAKRKNGRAEAKERKRRGPGGREWRAGEKRGEGRKRNEREAGARPRRKRRGGTRTAGATQEKSWNRVGERAREEGPRPGHSLENERRETCPVNGNGLDCTRRTEREREQASAAGHHNVFWLLRSVRSSLRTSVRLSVVCPGTPTECIARLAPVKGL